MVNSDHPSCMKKQSRKLNSLAYDDAAAVVVVAVGENIETVVVAVVGVAAVGGAVAVVVVVAAAAGDVAGEDGGDLFDCEGEKLGYGLTQLPFLHLLLLLQMMMNLPFLISLRSSFHYPQTWTFLQIRHSLLSHPA